VFWKVLQCFILLSFTGTNSVIDDTDDYSQTSLAMLLVALVVLYAGFALYHYREKVRWRAVPLCVRVFLTPSFLPSFLADQAACVRRALLLCPRLAHAVCFVAGPGPAHTRACRLSPWTTRTESHHTCLFWATNRFAELTNFQMRASLLLCAVLCVVCTTAFPAKPVSRRMSDGMLVLFPCAAVMCAYGARFAAEFAAGKHGMYYGLAIEDDDEIIDGT
jgi:hypothetical protein